jgi:hypothetical protein
MAQRNPILFTCSVNKIRDAEWKHETRSKNRLALAIVPDATHYDIFTSR